jgi:hypothetical protein
MRNGDRWGTTRRRRRYSARWRRRPGARRGSSVRPTTCSTWCASRPSNRSGPLQPCPHAPLCLALTARPPLPGPRPDGPLSRWAFPAKRCAPLLLGAPPSVRPAGCDAVCLVMAAARAGGGVCAGRRVPRQVHGLLVRLLMHKPEALSSGPGPRLLRHPPPHPAPPLGAPPRGPRGLPVATALRRRRGSTAPPHRQRLTIAGTAVH